MPMKRYKPEQIVTLLRQIEVEIANGKATPQACKEAEITVQTFYQKADPAQWTPSDDVPRTLYCGSRIRPQHSTSWVKLPHTPDIDQLNLARYPSSQKPLVQISMDVIHNWPWHSPRGKMQAACVHCGAQYVLKDTTALGRPKVKFRCTKCDGITIVEVKTRADHTISVTPLPSFARADATTGSLRLPNDDSLRLPADARLKLTVIKGTGQGNSFVLDKARSILGRKGADIALADPEVSQRHAVIEVRDTMVSLKDLNSLNGTYFEEERVRAAVLLDGAEFRIGTTVLRLSTEDV
jgi:hypothetical protein